jgi:hypothetical protein
VEGYRGHSYVIIHLKIKNELIFSYP